MAWSARTTTAFAHPPLTMPDVAITKPAAKQAAVLTSAKMLPTAAPVAMPATKAKPAKQDNVSSSARRDRLSAMMSALTHPQAAKTAEIAAMNAIQVQSAHPDFAKPPARLNSPTAAALVSTSP